eukprot:3272745-Rhodomonas_salina.4
MANEFRLRNLLSSLKLLVLTERTDENGNSLSTARSACGMEKGGGERERGDVLWRVSWRCTGNGAETRNASKLRLFSQHDTCTLMVRICFPIGTRVLN